MILNTNYPIEHEIGIGMPLTLCLVFLRQLPQKVFHQAAQPTNQPAKAAAWQDYARGI